MGILTSLMSIRRQSAFITLLCLLLFAPLHIASADSSNRPEKETKLKSLILYRALKLIGWQMSAKQDAVVFRYCMIDDPHLAAILKGVVAGKKSGRKPIDVVTFDENDPVQNCHILYVGHDSELNDSDEAKVLFEKLNKQGVLIIGSNSNIIPKGGHINLNSFRNKIGFEISEELLLGYRFKLNSRLAGFATIVRPKAEESR